MSAHIAVITEAGVVVFTDAASYDDDGVVLKIGRKIAAADRVPLAVMTRGNGAIGDIIKQMLCRYADELGVDGLIAAIPGMIHQIVEADGLPQIVENLTEVVIAAHSPTDGPVIYLFVLGPEWSSGEFTSNKLIRIPSAISAPSMRPGDFDHIPELGSDESLLDCLRRRGAEMMEVYRQRAGKPWRKPGEAADRDLDLQFLIGGHCDMTIVTAAGVTTETVRVWDDQIGRKIDPHRKRTAPQPFTGMNRKQRRAMEAANGNRRMAG